jgi:hypothetical protein
MAANEHGAIQLTQRHRQLRQYTNAHNTILNTVLKALTYSIELDAHAAEPKLESVVYCATTTLIQKQH